jgi:membrane protein implicated in regulation of membrane protease activity
MITWTESARAALDSHNQAVRQQLLASGADPDEVAADLHRHIEEELAASKIHVASREDVQRVLAQMGVAMPNPPASRIRPKASLYSILFVGLALVILIPAVSLYERAPSAGSERPAAAATVEAPQSAAQGQAVRQDQTPPKATLLDWTGYSPAQKTFYGIGSVAAFLIVILGFFQLIGMEIHADIDHPDHNGASLFSVKPIIGFFFGLGWAGGACSGRMSIVPALSIAVLAGLCAMIVIWAIVRTFVRCQNDGSMQIQSAIGKEGVVYTTVDPAAGGLVQVALNTGLETLPAVTREAEPISTGKTVTVIRLDGPNLLVETKKT